MGEYEDAYPDAYGRREETDPAPRRRHFLGLGLPRQVRDARPAVVEAPDDAAGVQVVNIEQAEAADQMTAAPPPAHHVDRPRRPLVQRSPQEIAEDAAEQLAASPFIDASGVSIAVDGSTVTLTGTINSLIAISLAQALVGNVPGVGRVQVQLRIRQAPRPRGKAGVPGPSTEPE
jgi:hypothetical protein